MRELLETLVRVRVFTWQEVEASINTKVLLILEKFLSHPGETRWKPKKIDLSYGIDRHGLNWFDLQLELKLRQQQWASYQPTIPSMDAIPVVTPRQLRLVSNPQIKKHFQKFVDGKNTLVDIAERLGKDPLKIAKNYVSWASNGWLSFTSASQAIPASHIETKAKTAANVATMQARENTATVSVPVISVPSADEGLPTVLSVDDSAIIQLTIRRALEEHYNVLLADRATKALGILEERAIDLLLLDLTMPDMDGLEFCRIVRQMPKFKDLPIVMVTARDGLVNQMKGHLAGTSVYLTKPFSPDELREVVHQHIHGEPPK